jgi:hypothetical protein
MHVEHKVKLINAQQAKPITIRTSKKNFTKLTPPFGLTKYAKQNTSHQTAVKRGKS